MLATGGTMNDAVLNLSIGDVVAESRFSGAAWSGAVLLHGRPLDVRVTAAAVQAAMASQQPVLAQLELYFSCLVRKQLRFIELGDGVGVDTERSRILLGLYLAFRSVCTRHCSIAEAGDVPPVDTMPVIHPERFVPDWLKIDFRAGQWLGEYGYARQQAL
jgi:hypothetical protein